MKKKEIPFDVADLTGALDEALAYAKGKATLRTTTLPSPAKVAKPLHIARIRRRMNVSQALFAKMLNVSQVTAKSWENGRRQPSGPACRLLEIAEAHPQVFTMTK